MPVDISDIMAGIKTTPKPETKANKSTPQTETKSPIQTGGDLSDAMAGIPLKKKVGSEETTTDTSKDQYTIKLTDEAQSDLGITLANDAPKGVLYPVKGMQFANIPKPKTERQKLEEKGKSIMGKQNALLQSVNVFNNSYGTKFIPQETLSDVDKAADFLNLYKNKVAKADFDINTKLLPSNLIASSESFGQPKRPITQTVIPDVELLINANKNEKLLADHVIDLTIDEATEKNIPQKKVINDLHKRLDPKGFDRIKKAYDDRTSISTLDVLTGNNPFLKDNAKDFELLNTEKAPYEFLYNEGLQRKADDYLTIGTLTGNQDFINTGKSLAAKVQSEDQIYSKYPSFLKSKIAGDFAREIAEKTGQLKGSDAESIGELINKFSGGRNLFDTETFKKYYDNPQTKDALLDVVANADKYVSDASFLGGIGKNLAKPFKELFHSVGDITGIRDKMDRLVDTKNEELFPEITPEIKGYVSKIKGAVNTTAYLTGMMALQIPGTQVGTAIGLGTKGAHRLGTAMAFGIPSFDANLKDADNFLESDGAKVAYATLGSMINTVGGEMLELGKISKFKELQTPLKELAGKMTDKNITEKAVSELLDKAKNPYVNALMKYGTNVTKGAAVMSYFTFANGVNKMLFGGEGTTKELVENTGTAFVEGLLGMSVLGGFGAHADLKREKNTTYKKNIYQLALNHDAARDVIETAYKNGEYDRPTYNEKIQILNTAIAAKSNLDIAEAGNNITLDEGQRAVYVTNRTAEGVIKKKLESPLLTEEQKGTYEAQIKRLKTQREDILKGLTFNDNLEPLNEVFEAQKEYKKAYEDFNEGVVENDSEVIKAKQKLESVMAEYSNINTSKNEKDNAKSSTKEKDSSETGSTKTADSGAGRTDIVSTDTKEANKENRTLDEGVRVSEEDNKFVEESFDNGLAPVADKSMLLTDGKFDKTKVEPYLKLISEQAQGIDENGKPLEGGGREESMLSQGYDKSIIDLAKEKYPKPEIKEEIPNESGIVVIPPQSFPEPITIGEKIEPKEKSEPPPSTVDSGVDNPALVSVEGENAIVKFQQNNPEVRDLPLNTIEEDLNIGDTVHGNIKGQKVSGKVTNVGVHKGQIVVDITDQNGNDRFLYSKNIERIDPKPKEAERLTTEQDKRYKELINKEETTSDEMSEMDKLGKMKRGEIPNPKKELPQSIPPKSLPNPTVDSGVVKPTDIHELAKEKGIDYESKDFMGKSEELTGERHLDKMDGEQLQKVKDFILSKEAIPVIESGETLSVEGGGGKKPPIDTKELFGEGEDAGKNKEEFDKMTNKIPNDNGELGVYLSGETITDNSASELRNDQTIVKQPLLPAFQHGQDIVAKAKEIFGEKDYVEKTLQYLEKENLSPDMKALIHVTLENEMEIRVEKEPDNLGLKKLQDLVRAQSQAYLRSNSLAINMGRARALQKFGYDISKVTDPFFSSKEKEQKQTVEKLVQADADTIQKQYEDSFNERVNEAAEKLRAEERKEERKAKKEKVHKLIDETTQKWIDKLTPAHMKGIKKSGIGVEEVLKSVSATMKKAYDAGEAISKVVQDAIDYISEKLGKEVWDNLDREDFRKDYEDKLIDLKETEIANQQKKQLAKEYRILETERNRQLAIVGNLTEKLKTLQSGERPVANTKESKLDVPEIETLKSKIKEETTKLNSIDAQQKRIDGLETELERLQNRLPKEKNETAKRQISWREQELKNEIETEKETIRKEDKENNNLRLANAKDAVRERIEKIKTEIATKERELKESNKPLNEDLELTRLREIEKSITELRDKYLPEEKDPFEAEKQRERTKDKLVSDIITLNEQINQGERNRKPDKPNYDSDAEISKLRKIKEAKTAILNEIDPLSVPKEKTTVERVATAEENLQKKIDAVRDEIISGERDFKKSKDKLQSKKLDQLREQKKALELLRDKYLGADKDRYAKEKNVKTITDRLVKENIELNRQINKGEKDIKEEKQSVESENIDKLKAERDARKEILEAIDPTPKIYVENALIEQGFGKTINVKTKNGVEERQVLDWKKLAGAEGSVTKISENVATSLEKSGFTPDQLERMSDAFITEYTNIRKDVIEKGLNEIATRNKETVTPEQKGAAKKLAEMYNYGLFDKNIEEYEIALAKTIGVSKLNAENLKEALVLGKASADLFSSKFQGERLTETQMRSAIQVIETHMRNLLHSEANEHGSTALKLADIGRTYMDLVQRMTLNSLKQATENPLSGQMESFFTSIGYAGEIPSVLNKQARKIARDIYKEMVLEKGTHYGEVSSTFVNKGNLEKEIDKMSDNKLVQGIMSTLIGKTTLDAVDSAYKAKITQQKFTYNLIKILQNDRLIDGKIQKGMSKEEAKNYVAEKLSGQSFKDAQTTAKEIIDRINTGAKQKIFNDSPLFVDRLASDIVTAALVNGEKISAEMVTASYNAAYRAAGRGLGHVANNFISRSIANVSGQIEKEINDAVKEKEYNRGAFLTVQSIFFRNIANPFVGGGTNWVFLKAEKTGLGLVSGLGSMMMKKSKMDLTSETGIKHLEQAMYDNMKIKDKMIRGAIGGATTVVAAMIMAGVTNTDEYRKWRLKNMWAAKYLDLVTPEIVLAGMSKTSKEVYHYFTTVANRNQAFDKGEMAFKAVVATAVDIGTSVGGIKESKDQNADAKWGKLAGSIFGAPTPWRLVRDGQQIWVGAEGGEPYRIDNTKPETFWQAYLKGGMIDYMGFAPKPDKK